MSEWRPIETAPLEMDGDAPVVLLWNGYVMRVGEHGWTESGKPVFWDGECRVHATHWMPLPEPPK